MMVNDEYAPARGKLVLTAGGARAETSFDLPALGQQTYNLDLRVPAVPGPFLIKATANPEKGAPTVSRRKVIVE